MLLFHNYTQFSIISRKISNCHSLLLFAHLHFISLNSKNKLNLENNRMLELHKKMVKLK